MKDDEWHSGPPPSVGWWPASIWDSEESLRWWNGECWSRICHEGDGLDEILKQTAVNSAFQDEIRWKQRPNTWPKRSKT